MKKENKKSQITIFIIIAIILILFLILIFRGRIKNTLNGKPPITLIQECINRNVQEAINKISVQGGEINPQFYYMYEGYKLPYLCYTDEYYKTCVMQKPLLVKSIKKEIKKYAQPRIKDCVENLKKDLEKKDYKVKFNKIDLNITFTLEGIKCDVDSDLEITKESTQLYKSIKTEVPSKLYELIMLSTSILNWEATYGDSSSMTYMMYYPSIKVEKKIQGDGTKVYILTNRNTKEKFMFAVRSVVIPSGITGN